MRSIRSRAVTIAAFLVAAALCPFGGVAGAVAPTPTQVRSTHEVTVAGLRRSWLEIAPVGAVANTVPIIVVLSGINATAAGEAVRDGFVPLVTTNRVELIYPVSILKSWNAGGCCGKAAKENVNDVAFLEALVSHVDPTYRRPIYLVGYSNGGRLAYALACKTPKLFGATAIMKAMPDPSCVVSRPQTILQIDSTNDNHIAYLPGEPATEQPAATTQVARLRQALHCSAAVLKVVLGALLLEEWNLCASHNRLEFAIYTGGKHGWPWGSATTPSGASVIWSFFSRSPMVRPFFPPTPACAATNC